MSFLGCNTFCIIVNFLVLWSICLSSLLDQFKNGPKYLTRGTVRVFIPLMSFPLQSLVSRSFFVLLWSFFLIFSFISNCVLFQYTQFLVIFLLYTCSGVFLILAVLFIPLIFFSHFYYQLNPFFNANFNFYILTVRFYYLYQRHRFLFTYLLI